jgi:hypothetical protein
MIGFESVGWKNSSTYNPDLVTFMTLHGIMILFWLCTSNGFIMVIYSLDSIIMVMY